MRLTLIIGLFGAVGAVSRFGLDRFFSSIVVTEIPIATLLVNVFGSFLLGALYGLGTERSFLSPEMSVALGVGLLGGFTTFSSYSLQTFLLGEQRQFAMATGYFLLSPLLGLFAAWLGLSTARLVSS